MRRAAQKGAEMATLGGLLAGDYKKDDGDGKAPAFDALFPLVNVKNRAAVSAWGGSTTARRTCTGGHCARGARGVL
jgi:hypothetical protein